MQSRFRRLAYAATGHEAYAYLWEKEIDMSAHRRPRLRLASMWIFLIFAVAEMLLLWVRHSFSVDLLAITTAMGVLWFIWLVFLSTAFPFAYKSLFYLVFFWFTLMVFIFLIEVNCQLYGTLWCDQASKFLGNLLPLVSAGVFFILTGYYYLFVHLTKPEFKIAYCALAISVIILTLPKALGWKTNLRDFFCVSDYYKTLFIVSTAILILETTKGLLSR